MTHEEIDDLWTQACYDVMWANSKQPPRYRFAELILEKLHSESRIEDVYHSYCGQWKPIDTDIH